MNQRNPSVTTVGDIAPAYDATRNVTNSSPPVERTDNASGFVGHTAILESEMAPGERIMMQMRVCAARLTGVFAVVSILMSTAAPRAQAQWTVTNLHPARAVSSRASGVFGGRQVGTVSVDGVNRASLWSGTAASWVDLHPAGARESQASGISADQQVGTVFYQGGFHASLWSGTAASYVDLHTGGGYSSVATGVSDGVQVGFASVLGRDRAYRWAGSAASGFSISSLRWSWANGISGSRVIWDGVDSAGYRYVGVTGSGGWSYQSETAYYYGVSSDQVVGAYTGATLWSGSADSVSLHPAGASSSVAYGVFGGMQAGCVTMAGVSRASVWTGTAESWVDLHAFLPIEFSSSEARSIWRDESITHVAGSGFNTLTGRTEALLWTLGSCPAPSVITQPAARTTCPGGSATFSIVARGDGPLSFAWRRNGVVIADEANHISGTNTATLVIVNAVESDTGSYDCLVTNACSSVTSDSALLGVCNYVGDLNCNGRVGTADLAILLSNFGRVDGPTRSEGELTGDGAISLADLVLLLGDYGGDCP